MRYNFPEHPDKEQMEANCVEYKKKSEEQKEYENKVLEIVYKKKEVELAKDREFQDQLKAILDED